MPSIQQPNHDPALKISWARDVFSLVDRLQQPSSAIESASAAPGPVTIHDPQLLRLVQVAVPTVMQVAALGTQVPMPTYVAEAMYFRATFAATGAYPEHVKLNPRQAFRDYEASARAGHHIAWFKIGRDYETFKDVAHAKDCFERGVRLGVEACLYVSLDMNPSTILYPPYVAFSEWEWPILWDSSGYLSRLEPRYLFYYEQRTCHRWRPLNQHMYML